MPPSISAVLCSFDRLPSHPRLLSLLQRVCARVGQHVADWRDAYAAAVLYDELHKLPDVELRRRGMPRDDLHRHVFRTAAG